MKTRMNNLLVMVFLGLLFLVPASVGAQGMIRTTGDNTGISFAEETRGARHINGNVRGVSFSQWVYGYRGADTREFSRLKTLPTYTYDPSYYRDTTRILSTDNRGALLQMRTNEGVLVAD